MTTLKHIENAESLLQAVGNADYDPENELIVDLWTGKCKEKLDFFNKEGCYLYKLSRQFQCHKWLMLISKESKAVASCVYTQVIPVLVEAGFTSIAIVYTKDGSKKGIHKKLKGRGFMVVQFGDSSEALDWLKDQQN